MKKTAFSLLLLMAFMAAGVQTAFALVSTGGHKLQLVSNVFSQDETNFVRETVALEQINNSFRIGWDTYTFFLDGKEYKPQPE